MVNAVPPAYGDDGHATPPPMAGFPPKYTQAHYEEVGKALCIAALDFYDINPWSRITLSELNSLHGVREHVRRYLRSLRGGPRLPKNPVKTYIRNNLSNNQNNGRLGRVNSIGSETSTTSRTSLSRNNSINSDSSSSLNTSSRFLRKDSNSTNIQKQNQQNQNQKRELGPIRETRNNVPSLQRRKNIPHLPSNYVPPGSRSSTSNQNTPSATSSSSAPVTLSMTTAQDTKIVRQLSSADSIIRSVEEEQKLNQLRNVSLLAIAKKTGPPSRIPLPTGNGNVKLHPEPQDGTLMPRAPSRSNSRCNSQRTTPQTYPLKKASAELLPNEGTVHFSDSLNRAHSTLGSAGITRSPYSNSFPVRQNVSSVLGGGIRNVAASATPSLVTSVPGVMAASPSAQQQVQNIDQSLQKSTEQSNLQNLRRSGVEMKDIGTATNNDKIDNSDSPKRRRRYTYLKRRNPSPKLGSAGNKGQGKQSSATDSDVEKARPSRRRRRKSVRNKVAGNQSLSDDENGEKDLVESSLGMNSSEGTVIKESPSKLNSISQCDIEQQMFLKELPGNRKRYRSPYEEQPVQLSIERKRLSQSSPSSRHHQAQSQLTVFWVE